ncbi:MAG: hypothetical protein J7M38_07995, partial [Armatimonadetes bacterium]|nr:hypothetical protein [Armatimonadota bacterium]
MDFRRATVPALIALIVFSAWPCSAAPVPGDLYCEWRVNNQAVRDICPELYWQADGQVACQVLVATSDALLAPGKADMWDTGRLDTKLPIVEYSGEPLADATRYFWKVRVWDDNGGPGEWSPVQSFTTDFKPLPALRPHMRYFVNFGCSDARLMAERYDISFRPQPNDIRPEYIALHYCLMATMVVPSVKCEDLAAWCAREGLTDNLSEEGVPEAMFCHFAAPRKITLHVGAEKASNPLETRIIPGWDPRNDRNGDGIVDDEEFANLVNPEAKARRWRDARIPIYYWGPPRDDYVMYIGHPDYQRYLAEVYMPAQLTGGYDGWFVDTTPSNVPVAGVDTPVVEYPREPNGDNAWMRDMQMVMAKVKINLPDTVLTANGWSAKPFVLDGRENENWLNITIGGGGFEARLRQVVNIDRRGKLQMIQYNPIYTPERSEFGPKVPVSLERDAIFGLASYYLCAGDYSYYGYGRHPYSKAVSWYNAAADYDVGEPLGPYEKIVISRAGETEAENLLANGDFELDEDGDGLPDGWEIAPPVVFDEDVVKSGKRSVRIDSDSVTINNFSKYWVTLKPDTTYTFSGWMKTENITGGQGAQMYPYAFDGAAGGGIRMVLHGTNDWTHMSQTFKTADDVEGRVNFRVYGSTGTAWFDDLRLTEGADADVVIYARRFSKALVLVRPSEPALG